MKIFHRTSNLIFTIFLFVFFAANAQGNPNPNIKELDNVYDSAQSIQWLNDETFAIGRWNGIISIFQTKNKQTGITLKINQTLIPEAHSGVQMIANLGSDSFVSSNDDRSLEVWKKGNKNDYITDYTINYQSYAGVANSALLTSDTQGNKWLISGHSNGFIIIWKILTDNKIEEYKIIDIKSPHPIPSPLKLKNIRSIAQGMPNEIITGSEDGDVCVISVPSGEVLYRFRYNPTAQRGINNLATLSGLLLLSNCTVGAQDKNFWLYRISDSHITLLDSINLIKDKTKVQTFGLGVSLAKIGEDIYFFASTGEGLLWYGKIVNGKFDVLGNTKIEEESGAVLAFEQKHLLLVSAAHAIKLFKID